MSTPFPDNCPECQCELYPSHRTRPLPTRTTAGRLVLAGGFLLSGCVFLSATGLLLMALPLPVVVAALVACVPSLSVGYAGAVVSERLGRVLKVGCRKCGWAHTFPSGHRAYGTRSTTGGAVGRG